MKEFINFCKKHLNEIFFALWTLVFTVIFLQKVSAANWCFYGLGIGFLGNVILSLMLSKFVHTEKKLNVLSWSVFISTVTMAFVFWYGTKHFLNDAWYLAGLATIFSSFVCFKVAEKGSRLNIELENLRNTDYAEYLRKMIEHKRSLEEKEEESLLKLPNAEGLVSKYIEYCRFWRPIEDKFLADKRFSAIWGEYFKLYSLSDAQEMKLFDRSDAKEIIALYCGYSQMCERAELKLFTMPDAKEWVNMYIKKGAFYSEKAEKKLFEIPEYKELADYYKSRYALYDDTHQMIYELQC
ncbi:MAG: hypothetical protein IJ677_04900 [Alphaproteobacteria bacterium]|nr:hypothetical protein [Alphaproteobacteria bacterium]